MRTSVQKLAFSLVLTLVIVCPLAGSQAQTPTGEDPHELAKKLSNPVSSLISFPFQSNFDFGMGEGSGWRYTLNIQPVVPFVSSTFLQPFLAYNTRDAWTYTVNTESSYDWIGNNWSIPINFTITRLTKFGRHPVSLGGGIKCWANSGPDGPENCGARIVVTPLFPK